MQSNVPLSVFKLTSKQGSQGHVHPGIVSTKPEPLPTQSTYNPAPKRFCRKSKKNGTNFLQSILHVKRLTAGVIFENNKYHLDEEVL